MDYDFPPESRNDQADEWRKMYLEQKAENERLRAELARWEEVAAKIPRLRGAYEQLKVCPMCDLKLYDGKICRSCDYGCER